MGVTSDVLLKSKANAHLITPLSERLRGVEDFVRCDDICTTTLLIPLLLYCRRDWRNCGLDFFEAPWKQCLICYIGRRSIIGGKWCTE